MEKRCVYCRCEISESSAVDVCQRCGIGVWGEKMFKAIQNEMDKAKENGNLFQGSITDPQPQKSSLHKTSQ